MASFLSGKQTKGALEVVFQRRMQDQERHYYVPSFSRLIENSRN